MQHGCCWQVRCLSVTNSSVTVHLAQASSLDMLVLFGEVRMQAGLHTIHTMLHKASWCVSLVFGVDQLVRHVENGLLEIFRLVCGSSAQAPGCWHERRR